VRACVRACVCVLAYLSKDFALNTVLLLLGCSFVCHELQATLSNVNNKAILLMVVGWLWFTYLPVFCCQGTLYFASMHLSSHKTTCLHRNIVSTHACKQPTHHLLLPPSPAKTSIDRVAKANSKRHLAWLCQATSEHGHKEKLASDEDLRDFRHAIDSEEVTADDVWH